MTLKELNEWLQDQNGSQSNYNFKVTYNAEYNAYSLDGHFIGTPKEIKAFVMGACWERNR